MNSNGATLRERFCYVMPSPSLQLTATSTNALYSPFEPIEYHISMKNHTGQPIQGPVSYTHLVYEECDIYVGQEKHRGMYNTAEILLLGNNVEDDRLTELKSKVQLLFLLLFPEQSINPGYRHIHLILY